MFPILEKKVDCTLVLSVENLTASCIIASLSSLERFKSMLFIASLCSNPYLMPIAI